MSRFSEVAIRSVQSVIIDRSFWDFWTLPLRAGVHCLINLDRLSHPLFISLA